MRALLLGSQSFLDTGCKVGIQYIAEGLAGNGWKVDYISTASSPFDLLSPARRARFKRIWLKRQDINGYSITPNLTEYALRAPFPTRKEVLRFSWQIKVYPLFVPEFLLNSVYDVCIHDSSNTFLFLPKLKARHFIYRLNDLPSGFAFSIHRHVIESFDNAVASGRYDEIWAVSKPLAGYAAGLTDKKILILPNGIDANAALDLPHIERRPRSAVFVGGILPWVDMELVDKSASLLPDWNFDFYGPLHVDWQIKSSNITYKGKVEHKRVLDVLSRYSVGLIPFRDVAGLIKVMERPLKFYEYISCGLGVAATDVGSLRLGMGNWASYGRTPDEFAGAIASASVSGSLRKRGEVRSFIEEHSWNRITGIILARLEDLLKGGCGDDLIGGQRVQTGAYIRGSSFCRSQGVYKRHMALFPARLSGKSLLS